MLEKILVNLLSNAFKHTFEGDIAVETRLSADGRHAEALVIDTGIGMAADQLPRLFERFHRIDCARGRSFEGMGIGLALVRELVALHGGSISVESEPSCGTTFRILTSLGVAHMPAEQVRASSAPPQPVNARAFIMDAARWSPDVDRPTAATPGRSRNW